MPVEIDSNLVWEKLIERSGGSAFGWAEFVGTALFDPLLGYYRKAEKRVGGEGADFYTSVSLKEKVFSGLILAAAKKMLSDAGENPDSFDFYEIGAEPETQIIEGSKTARIGEKIEIPPNAIVISNELLDSRPFERFAFLNGQWRKRMISAKPLPNGKVRIVETLEAPSDAELSAILKYFPNAREGFLLDISFDAIDLFGKICAQNWRGILIFADYFRSCAELMEIPSGTARAYESHKDSTELFLRAGARDITHSPCFEPLLDTAKAFGFSVNPVVSQGDFFMGKSTDYIRTLSESRDAFDTRKRELAQLLSPVFMGEVFRIMSATRL